METIKKIKKENGLNNLKKEFKEGKIVLGTKKTIKLLKKGKIEKIYLSNTAPKFFLELEELKKIELEYLNIDALGVGKLLGKNFPVSVIGVTK